MVGIVKLFLFAAVTAVALVPRDFATVQTDLKNIDVDVQKITKDCKDGCSFVALSNDLNALSNDVNRATNDIKTSPVFTSTQATTLINYLNNTLEPAIKAAINALIACKAAFMKNGLDGAVCNNLQTVRANETSLGSALLARCPQAQKSAANAAQNKIVADIQRGVTAFC